MIWRTRVALVMWWMWLTGRVERVRRADGTVAYRLPEDGVS